MTIEHNQLTGAALHNSKILTFTGDPSTYTPPESGILVCCLTPPNAGKLYRTTGTTPGAVALLAAGQDGAAATISVGSVTTTARTDPPTVANSGTASSAIFDFTFPANLAVAETFTGSAAAYTPTEAGVLVVKADVTPNQLYRATGTTAGAIVAVGLSDLDADLAAIAALSTTGAIERTGAGTATTFTVTSFAKNLLDDPDAATARTTLDAAATSHTQDWVTITSTPTTLAGYGIADAQPLDADLTALAGLATTGVIERTGAGTAATFTVTSFAKNLLDDPDAATARTTLDAAAANHTQTWSTITSRPTTLSGYGITDAQPLDADLTAIAALATTGAIERTADGSAATFTVTANAKQLLDDSTFAAMRTTLELGSISTQSASNVAITGGSISGITDLAIADGGTGSSTAQGAINALAGAVTSGQYLRGNGTNVVMSAIQASDVPTLNQNTTGTASNVTGIVAVANGGTGANTVPQARTNLGLVIGTDVQAYDADLAAIAALSTTGLIERTGAGTAAIATLGTTGRSLIAVASELAARTAIGITVGTWTPSFILTTSGSVNYGNRTGTYLLVGNYVFFTADLSTTSLNSPSGSVRISLPFTSDTSSAASLSYFVGITASQWNTTVSTAMFSALIVTPDQITLRKNAAGAVASDVVAADLNTGANGNLCRVAGMYVRAI